YFFKGVIPGRNFKSPSLLYFLKKRFFNIAYYISIIIYVNHTTNNLVLLIVYIWHQVPYRFDGIYYFPNYLQSATSNYMASYFYKHVKGRKTRSEEHTSELQSRENLVCRL